jgi:hypothetical protein
MNGATVHEVVRAQPTTAITPKPPVRARKMERRRDPGTPAVAHKAAASTDAEWTPVVLHGSPTQMVTNFVSQAPLAARAALIVSTGTHLIVFFGRQHRGTFQLDKGAAQLPRLSRVSWKLRWRSPA